MVEKSCREFFTGRGWGGGRIEEIRFWGRDTAFCGSAVHLNKLQNGGSRFSCFRLVVDDNE